MGTYNANLITNKADTENVVCIFGLKGSKYWRSPVSSSTVPRYTSLHRDSTYQNTYNMAKFSMVFEAAGSQAKREIIISPDRYISSSSPQLTNQVTHLFLI